MTTAQKAATQLVRFARLLEAGRTPQTEPDMVHAINALVADWAVNREELAKLRQLTPAADTAGEWGQPGYDYCLGLARTRGIITGYTTQQALSAVQTWPDREDEPVLLQRSHSAWHVAAEPVSAPVVDTAAADCRESREPAAGRLGHVAALPPRFTRAVARKFGAQPNVEDWAIGKAIDECTLTVDEACTAGNLNTEYMTELLAAGTIPSERANGPETVRLTDLIAYLEEARS